MRIYDTLNKKSKWIFNASLDPEVVREIKSSDRRERYQEEKKTKAQEGSLDAVGYEPEYLSCVRCADQRPVEDEVMSRWMRGYLRQLMARLPPGERDVMEALFFADLSVRDTADKLGCRPSTVRERRRRGLLRLGIYLRQAGINNSKI